MSLEMPRQDHKLSHAGVGGGRSAGEHDVSMCIFAFVIKSIEGLMYFPDMFLCYADTQLTE